MVSSNTSLKCSNACQQTPGSCNVMSKYCGLQLRSHSANKSAYRLPESSSARQTRQASLELMTQTSPTFTYVTILVKQLTVFWPDAPKGVASMLSRGGQIGYFWISTGVRAQIFGHLYGQNKKIGEPGVSAHPKPLCRRPWMCRPCTV